MRRRVGVAAVVVAGLVVAGLLAVLVGPRASDEPDGLERVAIDQGFADEEATHTLDDAPTAGYQVEGVDDEDLSTGLAGIAGIAATFGVAGGLLLAARLLHRGRATGPAARATGGQPAGGAALGRPGTGPGSGSRAAGSPSQPGTGRGEASAEAQAGSG